MKVTRKKYEQAKALVEKAKAQLSLVKHWEDGLKKVGNVDKNKIVEMKFGDDGSVYVTVEAENGSTEPTEA